MLVTAPFAVPVSLLDLTEYPLAKCMDGSPAGYYYAPATSNASQSSWIVELEGGGECAAAAQCRRKLETSLGSSKHWKPAVSLSYFNQDTKENPRLREWNRVFIPYCSQDLWTGRRTAKSAETFGVFFSGHHIIDAVLSRLQQRFGLAHASEILLTGESAGGIGVRPRGFTPCMHSPVYMHSVH